MTTVDNVQGLAPRSPWVPERPDIPNIVPPPAPATVVEPERAEYDVLIERPDLGPGACTLIAVGDVIPSHLTRQPRRPARAEAAVAVSSRPRKT